MMHEIKVSKESFQRHDGIIRYEIKFSRVPGMSTTLTELTLDDLEETRDLITEFLNRKAVSEYLANTIGGKDGEDS